MGGKKFHVTVTIPDEKRAEIFPRQKIFMRQRKKSGSKLYALIFVPTFFVPTFACLPRCGIPACNFTVMFDR